MANYTRRNAWNNGGTFSNTDLFWYAKGVGVMQARNLDQTSSWWFFAAMHNEYLNEANFPGWGDIPSPPNVPTSPAPAASVSKQYWDQCQHQSWYFLPWHRGYLVALEAQIRADVVSLGGPPTWALPYWNYLGPGNEFMIPAAFTEKQLPNDGPNPLFVAARYGPDRDGNIYIPTPGAIPQHPHDPNFTQGPVTGDSMVDDLFTGSDTITVRPGFGGPETGFLNSGGTSGNLENNPHNHVHVYVGGIFPGGRKFGLMSDPGTAALDPIFYLHHANIDRMWAVWNGSPSNNNPIDPNWLSGPTAVGDRKFVMPMPDGNSWAYIPQQMNSLSQMDYTYDDLPAAPVEAAPVMAPLAARLTRLGASAFASKIMEGVPVTIGNETELVGATQSALSLISTGATASVRLDPSVRRKVSASLALASEAVTGPELIAPDRVYLNLENIRGNIGASVLSVYIDLPANATPADRPDLFAGSVALFGLRNASRKDGSHGGAGLSFVLGITKIVDQLHLNNALDVDSLQVRIVPDQPIPDQAEITIGRISIYREGQ